MTGRSTDRRRAAFSHQPCGSVTSFEEKRSNVEDQLVHLTSTTCRPTAAGCVHRAKSGLRAGPNHPCRAEARDDADWLLAIGDRQTG